MAVAQEGRRDTQWEREQRRGDSPPERSPEMERAERTVIRGFSTDAICSAGAVVLAILGLADIYPAYVAPIAVIAIGAALLFKSGAVGRRFSQLVWETDEIGGMAELAGGVSAEMAGGAAGVALGVLALVGIEPMTLMAVAVLVFGGAMLIGGGETYRLSQLGLPRRSRPAEHAARVSAETAGGAESMVGIAAVVLGILALAGTAPMTLVLIGLLCLSGAAFLSAFTTSAHAATLLRV